MQVNVYTVKEAEKLIRFLGQSVSLTSIENLTGYNYGDFKPGVAVYLDLKNLETQAPADRIAPFFPLAQIDFNSNVSVSGYDYNRLKREQWYKLIGKKAAEIQHVVHCYYLCLNADRNKIIEQIDTWNIETTEGQSMYVRFWIEKLKPSDSYLAVGIKEAFSDINFSEFWRSLEVSDQEHPLNNSWRKITYGMDRDLIAKEVDAMILIMADKIRRIAECAVFGDRYDKYLDY